MRIGALRLGIALVFVPGTIALAALSVGRDGDAPAKGALRLMPHGKIQGLYPGVTKQIPVRVRNGYPDPVRLGYVETAVNADEPSPACPAEYLVVMPKRRSKVVIPPGRSGVVKVSVTLSAAAPDSCQQALFPLRFEAGGRRL